MAIRSDTRVYAACCSAAYSSGSGSRTMTELQKVFHQELFEPVSTPMVRLMEAATRGWSLSTHLLYPRKLRRAIHTVLLVDARAFTVRPKSPSCLSAIAGGGTSACASASVSVRSGATGGTANAAANEGLFQPLPTLPTELWTNVVFRFLTRCRAWADG
jgi:hypothetical protein